MATTTIYNELIAVNAVSGTAIADNAVTSVHIAQNNVGTVQLALNSVTSVSIALNQVTGTQIANNAITSTQLADNAVTATKVPDGTQFTLGATTLTGALAGTSATFTSSVTATSATFTDDVAINNGSPELYFGTTGNHYNWRIAAQENTDAALQIDVGSQDTVYGNDTYSTLFTVKNTGKVGIGNTNPAGILHVDEGAADDARIIAETHAGGDSMILFSQGASGAGSPTWGIGLDAGSGTSDGLSIGFEDTGYDDFSLTSDSKLVITTTGYVGIGTTDPSSLLTIKNNGSGGTWPFRIFNSQDSDMLAGFYESSSGDGYNGMLYMNDGAGNTDVKLSTNGDSWFNGGDVGIGTTNPGAELDLRGHLRLDSGGSTSRSIYFRNQDSSSTGGGKIQSDQYLSLYAGNGSGSPTQYLTIEPGGNIGIGTDDPLVQLDVRGGSIMAGSNSETGGSLTLQNYYSGDHHLATMGTNHSSGGWYFGYGVKMQGSGTTQSTFSNFSGKRSFVQLFGDRMSYSFAGAQNTAIGSGVSGLSEKVRISEYGIAFNGDTGSANSLDDYEEGSWSPTSGESISSTTANRYVRVGSMVVYTIDVTFGSNSNGAGAALGNLPHDVTQYNSGFTGWQNSGNGLMMHCSGDAIWFYNSESNAALTYAALSGKRIIGTLIGVAS